MSLGSTCKARGCVNPALVIVSHSVPLSSSSVLVEFELCAPHADLYGLIGNFHYRYVGQKTRVFRSDGERIDAHGRTRLTDDELHDRTRAAVIEGKVASAREMHRLLREQGIAVDRDRVSEAYQVQKAAWTS